jgi:hypothetical protein
VVDTTNIVPGMIISGTGFTGNQTVVTVTNSTTLAISASANSTPSGTLTFTGTQGENGVAVGASAGLTVQGANAVAIGTTAGNAAQGAQGVAIGLQAGYTTQGPQSVAIGTQAGFTGQGVLSVALGIQAGYATQGNNSVAIGRNAGYVTQGANAVAIGSKAGPSNQANNSIIINATGNNLDQTTANTFTVAPVRNDVANIGNVMFYNATSKEITYGNTISVAGNITGGNISTGSRVVTTPVAFSALTAVTGARAFVNDGNLVAVGNFGAQVSGGGANTVPVWSNGTNWYIG